jgi:hypothetical protein
MYDFYVCDYFLVELYGAIIVLKLYLPCAAQEHKCAWSPFYINIIQGATLSKHLYENIIEVLIEVYENNNL